MKHFEWRPTVHRRVLFCKQCKRVDVKIVIEHRDITPRVECLHCENTEPLWQIKEEEAE